MEWLFSLLALPYDAKCSHCFRAPCDRRARVRLTDDGDDTVALSAISGVLRALSLPARLAHFRRPDPCAAREAGASECEHPDAADVLRRCREHSRWRRATFRGIELAYRSVLRHRCELAILEHSAAIDPIVFRAVLARIAAASRADAADAPIIVLAKLVWLFPRERNFNYSDEQIASARRAVLGDRRDIDGIGAASRLKVEPDASAANCRRAPPATPPERLPLESREVDACVPSRSVSPCCGASVVETVEALCKGFGTLVHAYVLQCLLNEGDWPEWLLEKLRGAVGRFDPPPLSKRQKERCRAKLRARLASLSR
jgi:hypothetical protein